MDTSDKELCDWCSEPYTPRREDQRFCSNGGKCRMAFHKDFMDKARIGRATTQPVRTNGSRVKNAIHVYQIIMDSPNGCTINECAVIMGKFPNQISGRFTELQKKGLIIESGIRRERSRVMIAAETKG